MELITTPEKLTQEFKRLINDYENFYWASAWAGTVNGLFDELKNNKHKIRKIAIGIHFYQTSPEFIKEFLNSEIVRFVTQPNGTFHPKIYLFTNGNGNWEMIVGSANFTEGAFSKNSEVSVLISDLDNNGNKLFRDAMKVINKSFILGRIFDEKEYLEYAKTYKTQYKKLNSLSGQYNGNSKKIKPIYQIPIINRNWSEFIYEVKNDINHAVRERIEVITLAQNLFVKYKTLNEMPSDERKFISGAPNKLNEKGAEFWGYFGSMKGAGKFKKLVNNKNPHISMALDQIPLSGQVTRKHFEEFVRYYQIGYPGNNIGTASRLLCMKRPDVFVSFNNASKNALCSDFGIKKTDMDYDRYWDEIIERIFDSVWWQDPEPKNEEERIISSARAAFLDSLYYRGQALK